MVFSQKMLDAAKKFRAEQIKNDKVTNSETSSSSEGSSFERRVEDAISKGASGVVVSGSKAIGVISDKSSDFVGPLQPAEQRADFVGPIQPAEQRADFVGPKKPVGVVDTPTTQSSLSTGQQQVRQGFISEAPQPTTITGKLSQARERLIQESQEGDTQFKRTAAGLSLAVVTPATTISGLVGTASKFILPPVTKKQFQERKEFGDVVVSSLLSPIKTGKKIIQSEAEEFGRDPVGFVATIGVGSFIGRGLTKKTVKATGQSSISGFNQKTGKVFAAGEGEVLVTSKFGKKTIPFQSKEISQVVTKPSGKILTSGERSIKIGKDIIESQVRGVSAEGKTLTIVKPVIGETFGELTITKSKSGVSVFQTKIIKETQKGLAEQFRGVGASKKAGKIGEFDIQFGAGLGQKVDEVFKVKQPTLTGSTQGITKTTTGTDLLTSQKLQSQLKTGSVFQAEQFVKQQVSTPLKPIVGPSAPIVKVVAKTPKESTGVSVRVFQEVKPEPLKVVTTRTTPTPKIKTESEFQFQPKISVVQKQEPIVKIDSKRRVKQTPSQKPISDQAQAQIKTPVFKPSFGSEQSFKAPLPLRPVIKQSGSPFVVLGPTPFAKIPTFDTDRRERRITQPKIKRTIIVGEAETLFRIVKGKAKKKKGLLGPTSFRI